MVILSAQVCETRAVSCVLSHREQLNSACEKCIMLNNSIHQTTVPQRTHCEKMLPKVW